MNNRLISLLTLAVLLIFSSNFSNALAQQAAVEAEKVVIKKDYQQLKEWLAEQGRTKYFKLTRNRKPLELTLKRAIVLKHSHLSSQYSAADRLFVDSKFNGELKRQKISGQQGYRLFYFNKKFYLEGEKELKELPTEELYFEQLAAPYLNFFKTINARLVEQPAFKVEETEQCLKYVLAGEQADQLSQGQSKWQASLCFSVAGEEFISGSYWFEEQSGEETKNRLELLLKLKKVTQDKLLQLPVFEETEKDKKETVISKR